MTKHETMVETYKHKQQVSLFIHGIIESLLHRSLSHDDSKLGGHEVDIFTEYTPKLANLTFGSDEYKKCLEEMQPALEHHYLNNSHHPQYYTNGIEGMNLVDIIEMLCDWKASSLRHNDGDIYKSLEINQERFGYSDELKRIMMNTIRDYF
jgi:hypothetical protein